MALTAQRGWRRSALGFLLGTWLAWGTQPAAAAEVTEDSVKAAYLYQFLGYVDWPPGSFAAQDAPLVIGLLGTDTLLAELVAVVAGRQSKGHPLQLRRLLPADSLDGLHVLYLGRSRPPAAMASVLPLPLLVVTDHPAGLPPYATLNFISVDRRVRFEASLRAAERAQLKLSARLLEVAERVQPP